jgi:hypothetical protein
MRRKLISLVALTALAPSANAAVVVEFINRGTPAGPTAVATGYTGYTIRLTETTGANITAVDMESGTNGLFGPFVQRWTSSAQDGVYDTPTVNVSGNSQNIAVSPLNFDSHLLQPGDPKSDSNYVGKINFMEDTGGAAFGAEGTQLPPFPPNTLNAGYVVSNVNGTIQAAFGINGPAQSSVFDLAYIVLPNDYVANSGRLRFGLGTALVAVAGGSPQLVVFNPAEPSTVLPLGLCGGMLLARPRTKRRQRLDRARPAPFFVATNIASQLHL